jgi:hypothetical protein
LTPGTARSIPSTPAFTLVAAVSVVIQSFLVASGAF